MGCKFCDVPKVGYKGNATFKDIVNQVQLATSLHPEVASTKRFNLHYARMGEPTFNSWVIYTAYLFAGVFAAREWGFHPVVSTMMPRTNPHLFVFLNDWLDLKDNLNGNAGLQLSINTTDEVIRETTMPSAMSLRDVSSMFQDLLQYREIPKGRKITLNFALTEAEVDAKKLRELFSPRYFLCKLTPMHNTKAVVRNGMITDGGYDHYYPYKKVEDDLKAEGFDVIVFIPSKEEDESRITCGNVILSSLKKGDR